MKKSAKQTRKCVATLLSLALCFGCKNRPTTDPSEEPSAAEVVEAETSASETGGPGTEDAAAPQAEATEPAQGEPREARPVRERRPEVEANRELAARLGISPPDPLLVSDLLTRADVRELTNFSGELLETSLAGIEAGPQYNTIRLQADGGYGFALQVWQHDEVRQLSAQFRRLRETYFDSQLDNSGLANEAFTADFQGIRHVGLVHRPSRSIAVVTCDRNLCDPIQIRAVAGRVTERL